MGRRRDLTAVKMISRILCAVLLAAAVVAAVDIQKDVTIGEAQREVDVSTQVRAFSPFSSLTFSHSDCMESVEL